jgi:hypothetical protein
VYVTKTVKVEQLNDDDEYLKGGGERADRGGRGDRKGGLEHGTWRDGRK